MSPLERSGEAWANGQLTEARRQYQEIVDTDPEVWGARFQLAWLDGIFGKLAPGDVRALDRPGLSDSAQQLLKALQAMIIYPIGIDGDEQDWDIDALRARGGAETFSSWWEQHGRIAAKAGLYGVASACLEEAERREPGGAYWDPPSWTHSLPAQLESHLALVRHPFA